MTTTRDFLGRKLGDLEVDLAANRQSIENLQKEQKRLLKEQIDAQLAYNALPEQTE